MHCGWLYDGNTQQFIINSLNKSIKSFVYSHHMAKKERTKGNLTTKKEHKQPHNKPKTQYNDERHNPHTNKNI